MTRKKIQLFDLKIVSIVFLFRRTIRINIWSPLNTVSCNYKVIRMVAMELEGLKVNHCYPNVIPDYSSTIYIWKLTKRRPQC